MFSAFDEAEKENLHFMLGQFSILAHPCRGEVLHSLWTWPRIGTIFGKHIARPN